MYCIKREKRNKEGERKEKRGLTTLHPRQGITRIVHLRPVLYIYKEGINPGGCPTASFVDIVHVRVVIARTGWSIAAAPERV